MLSRLFFAVLLAGMSLPVFADPGANKSESPKSEKLVLASYSVADLVIPIASSADVPAAADTSKDKKGWRKLEPRVASTEQTLINLIKNTIAPTSWAGTGGSGTMDYFPMTMTLVISQTPAVQEQISSLLATLRRIQDQEISVEVRMVSVPDDVMARLILDRAVSIPNKNGVTVAPYQKCPRSAAKPIIMDNAQVFRLMETLQQDKRVNVLQAPKLTMYNGQAASLDVSNDMQYFVTGVEVVQTGSNPTMTFKPKNEGISTGCRMSLQPVISADRQNVRVSLKIDLTDVDATVPLIPVTVPIVPDDRSAEPVVFTQYIQRPRINRLTCDALLAVPDGRTAVLIAGQQIQEVTSDPVPLLSEVPCVGARLREAAKRQEIQHFLVMVTPRVIITEEEEKQTGCGKGDEEECSCPGDRNVKATACKCKKRAQVKELLRRYQAACAAGRPEEATALAVQALALDPTCFSTSEGKQKR